MRFLASMSALLLASTLWAQEGLRFNRDIRPILTENCIGCHGPDSVKRKADLRIDSEDGLFGKRDEGPLVVKGKPDQSTLITRIQTQDKNLLMPPPNSHKKLTEAQKKTLHAWIRQGAHWEPHWSFVKPARPAVPAVKNQAWVKNPIDAFILKEIEAAGLTPATEADRRSLIRRASFDVRGLPPSPEEVEAFVKDTQPNAYERLLDRLFASPHYGEHRARIWLDSARYADTHGLHFDNYREMWPYRDWVIRAFNKNMPFDQFTTEQLAGDLLPNPTMDQLVATGFNRCNMTTNEGGTIAEENEALYAKDRVETTITVWLGLTSGCASCHNHKYDPLSMKDYYSFAAFFRNTTQGAMDGNIPDTPPIIVVPPEQDRAAWAKLNAHHKELLAGKNRRIGEGAKAFDAWIASGAAGKLVEPFGMTLQQFALPLAEGKGDSAEAKVNDQTVALKIGPGLSWGTGPIANSKALQFQEKGVLTVPGAGDFDADKSFALSAWVFVPGQEGSYNLLSKMGTGKDDKGRGWKLTLNNRTLSFSMTASGAKNAITQNSGSNRLQGGKWAHVVVSYDGSKSGKGIQFYVDGKRQQLKPAPGKISGTAHNSAPLRIGGDFKGGALADVRLLNRALQQEEVAVLLGWNNLRGELAKNATKVDAKVRETLSLLYFNRFDEKYRALVTELLDVEHDLAEIRARSPVTHVMQERPNSTATAFVLFRGEYDKKREQVSADTLSALNPMPKSAPKNRMGLAKWLTDAENPLTSRVAVNRFWQDLFGTGIVRSTEDFGLMGENPSHPELLDWLAVEFRESGWDVQKLLRLMLTSATYRQDTKVTPIKREKDPLNRLLARGPRFRMDAETVRDNALAASGLLVPKIGGASVKPYQPDGVWEAVAMIGSNTRDYRRDNGENLYRRSMYTFWKRGAPPASMEIMNAPNREFCTVRRERTNTPLQALVTLNDPQMVEAARQLAQNAIAKGGSDFNARLDYITLRLIARPMREDERKVVQDSLADLTRHFQANVKDAQQLNAVGEARPMETMDPATLAAWTMLTNQLMNLDEVLTR